MTDFDPHLSRTTTAMLSALQNAEDAVAWEAFDARFRPILHRVGRGFGLSDADAADLAQDVIIRFIQRYREGRYDRERGRLGAWLVGIARNAAVDLHRRRPKAIQIENLSERIAEPEELESMWRRCREDRILELAMERVRDAGRTDPRTFEAFQLVSIRGVSPAEVAKSLDLSVESVYAARSRVARRLQEAIAELENDYDEEL